MPSSAGSEENKENKPRENTTTKYRNAQDAQKCGQTKPSSARHEVTQANKAKQKTSRKLPLKRPLHNHNSASCGENRKKRKERKGTTKTPQVGSYMPQTMPKPNLPPKPKGDTHPAYCAANQTRSNKLFKIGICRLCVTLSLDSERFCVSSPFLAFFLSNFG